MTASVKWKNAGRLKTKLAKLPPTIQQAALQGLQDRAIEVTEAMKRIVPIRTGALRDSIGYSMPEDGAGNHSRVTVFAGDKRAWYAPLVEYGTQKTRAQSFFWPVWRAYRRSGKSKVTRRVNAAIKRLVVSNG